MNDEKEPWVESLLRQVREHRGLLEVVEPDLMTMIVEHERRFVAGLLEAIRKHQQDRVDEFMRERGYDPKFTPIVRVTPPEWPHGWPTVSVEEPRP